MAWGPAFPGLQYPPGGDPHCSIHGACAILAFACIAFVCIFRYDDTLDEIKDPSRHKIYLRRYKWLGGAMIASISSVLPQSAGSGDRLSLATTILGHHPLEDQISNEDHQTEFERGHEGTGSQLPTGGIAAFLHGLIVDAKGIHRR
jgi:hypothetical protein